MNFVVDLNLAYDKIVVSAKDFVILSDVLARSMRVDTHYTDNHGIVFIENPRRRIEASEMMSPILTALDLAAIREEERLAREEKEAARELTV